MLFQVNWIEHLCEWKNLSLMSWKLPGKADASTDAVLSSDCSNPKSCSLSNSNNNRRSRRMKSRAARISPSSAGFFRRNRRRMETLCVLVVYDWSAATVTPPSARMHSRKEFEQQQDIISIRAKTSCSIFNNLIKMYKISHCECS